MSLQWLIVGGGIHGVHLAARLMAEGGVEAEQLRIVDPAERLMARWRTCTQITGMTHLRSPSVHHLDMHPWSLQRFAGSRKNRKPGLFAPPYDRPALDLFNAHCDHVVETYGLDALHIQDRVASCVVECDGVTLGGADGQTYSAQNVVLAMGSGDRPRWPQWAPVDDSQVQHVFQPDFDGWPEQSSPQSVAVIGGGISAGQVALRLMKEGHDVHLICRHTLREHQFDSDPGWLGPKFMGMFSHERDMDRRRAMISQARHKGSVPPDVRVGLRRAISQDQLSWYEADVEGCLGSSQEGFELTLSDGRQVCVQRILLATGFESSRPGGAMLDALVEAASLPCAKCGYPVVDKALRWHPRIYVSGPLAELELGPTSRNIAGARRAGDRLIEGLRSGRPLRQAV